MVIGEEETLGSLYPHLLLLFALDQITEKLLAEGFREQFQ